ncbi:hypothetical protein EDB83DRAFT_1930261 [Lactarius deliciosus]|nr:hypothetical protein EDB83DRAFT_1930261 [Lactarius deliciosus]
MINSSLTQPNSTGPGAFLFWDPYSSKSSLRRMKRETRSIHNVSVGGDTPLPREDHTYRAVSTPSMQSRAQAGVGLHSKHRSLTTPGRMPSKTSLTHKSLQRSQISSIHIRRSATIPRTPRNGYLGSQRNSGPPRVYEFPNRGAPWKDGEETQHIEGAFAGEGGESDGDEELDEEEEEEEEGNDDSDNDNNEECESGGEGTEVPSQNTQPRLQPIRGLTTQINTRVAMPAARESYILRQELPRIVVHPAGPPSVTHSPPTGFSPSHSHRLPASETHSRPVSSTSSRVRPQRVLEGPHLPSPDGPKGDAAGASTEWGEGSEAGVSERRSQYSQLSDSSAARSILLERQVARREEEAARREEEARLKEEDARGLELAARTAFAWVQGLEARAGRIHDAAMQAEARAKRMDAKIWEREAEVLRRQAETARREVGLAKREIAVQRSEQEARRKAREARLKEAELLMKAEDVQRKEREALRMEEEVQRRELELEQSEEKLKRRAAEDQRATKDVVASAWERLKGRITRDPHVCKQNLSHLFQHRDIKFDDDGTGVGLGSSSDVDVDPETSTWVFVPAPRSRRRVEQWRSTIKTTLVEDQQSLSHVVTSEHTTPSGISSAQYTVKSVHSYKERMNRGPGSYFRHKR